MMPYDEFVDDITLSKICEKLIEKYFEAFRELGDS